MLMNFALLTSFKGPDIILNIFVRAFPDYRDPIYNLPCSRRLGFNLCHIIHFCCFPLYPSEERMQDTYISVSRDWVLPRVHKGRMTGTACTRLVNVGSLTSCTRHTTGENCSLTLWGHNNAWSIFFLRMCGMHVFDQHQQITNSIQRHACVLVWTGKGSCLSIGDGLLGLSTQSL
jgi:hypothetical protein